MILHSLQVPAEEFEQRTGWELNARGACKGDVCIPLTKITRTCLVDVTLLAGQLDMPIVHDEEHGLWALGPEAGGRALTSATAARLALPDVEGVPFDLRSLKGQKVLLIAWASW